MLSKLQRKSTAVALAFLLLLVLAACRPITAPTQPEEVEVPFQSLAVEEWGANFADIFTREPHVFLITSAAELSLLKPYILPEHLDLAHQTNFTTSAVIVLLRDVQPGSKHQVVIERITKRDNTLVIHARYYEPGPGEEAAAAETLPYHLVKIRRGYFDEATKLELQEK